MCVYVHVCVHVIDRQTSDLVSPHFLQLGDHGPFTTARAIHTISKIVKSLHQKFEVGATLPNQHS